MKLLHIADLHIGKRVNEFSMIPDQTFILGQIVKLAETEHPDAVLIAGDVYDKGQPSAEAVELLDDFLTKLAGLPVPVYMISGNHDSPERLGFASRLLKPSGLHIAGTFDGLPQKVRILDEYGAVNIYLLPFIKPATVNPYLEKPAETYEEAVVAALNRAEIDASERNVLLAHQFVTCGAVSPGRSASESVSVGGLDHVDASAFAAFDYVALGHLHQPQSIGRDAVRYAGSPLKYSFSEARHIKSATVVTLRAKGEVEARKIPLTPMRDLREIRGELAELLGAGREDEQNTGDYIHATLTNEEEIYDAVGRMRQVYPNLMALDFDNSRTRQAVLFDTASSEDAAEKSPLELFSEFYFLQNGKRLTPEQTSRMGRIFDQAGGRNE